MNLTIDFGKERDKQTLYRVLKQLKPTEYTVAIKQYKKGRSLNQNAYYFGIVLDTISRETGNEVMDLHDYFKKKFNPSEIAFKQTGESEIIGGSTTKFNTLQMEEYLEKIRVFALTELEIFVPLPNELIEQ